MNKAVYITLVFLLPIISAVIPVDHFQDIWIWAYVPFGAAYAIYVWFQPDQHMMKLITLTPVFFVLLALIIFPSWVAVESGPRAGLEFLGVVAVIAIPSSVLVGVGYVLLAYGLYAVFRKYGLLRESG